MLEMIRELYQRGIISFEQMIEFLLELEKEEKLYQQLRQPTRESRR